MTDKFEAVLAEAFIAFKTTEEGLAAVGFKVKGEDIYIACPTIEIEKLASAAGSFLNRSTQYGAPTEAIVHEASWYEVGITEAGDYIVSFTTAAGQLTRYVMNRTMAAGLHDALGSGLGAMATLSSDGTKN